MNSYYKLCDQNSSESEKLFFYIVDKGSLEYELDGELYMIGSRECLSTKALSTNAKKTFYVSSGNEQTFVFRLSIEKFKSIVTEFVNKLHEETFSNFNSFMQKFTTIITHEDYVIFDQVLNIICTIAKYKEEYIEVIIFNIIETLRKTKDLLKNRGTVIVTKLCNALKVDKIYSTFANVLLRMNDTDFVGRMINILDLFLLTAKDTEQLRSMLKNVKKSKEPKDKEFFEKIFRTWCINPVSSLILCLIAEYFELSYYLLIKLYIHFI